MFRHLLFAHYYDMPIKFTDKEVEKVCLNKWDIKNTGIIKKKKKKLFLKTTPPWLCPRYGLPLNGSGTPNKSQRQGYCPCKEGL